jgi:hypothetical protein
MSDPQPWHFTTALDLVDHWQTLFAGGFAVLAAGWTVWATTKSADRKVKEIQAQTRATLQQTEATLRLEDIRKASEASAFHVMLASAMMRVLAEVDQAKSAYTHIVQDQGTAESESEDAYAVRRCITKGAFAELRAACVRLGGDLTNDFLDLEREIDNFASQWVLAGRKGSEAVVRRNGKQAGLCEQLARIETMADELLQKAVDRVPGLRQVQRDRQLGGGVTGCLDRNEGLCATAAMIRIAGGLFPDRTIWGIVRTAGG